MIRVTIEILPGGDASQRRHLGTIEIINDGTGDGEKGNYSIKLSKFGNPAQTWIRGAVQGFDRIKRGPYDLLLQCLDATVGRRRK